MKLNFLGNTGVLVSEICFGTMTFGGVGRWEAIGKLQQDEVNEIMKEVIDGGVNFIDTANAYSYGQSEVLLGQSIRDLGVNRHDLVIATKVRIRMNQSANHVGLSRMSIMRSVEESLERLKMNHIDLLYVHGVDAYTPIEETMRGLEDVVRSGKVRYVGVCNTPAWQVAKANGIADKHQWTRFEALQYYYSLATRDIEREVLPMCQEEKLGMMPWSPLAGGLLSGKFTRHNEKAGDSRRDSFDFPPVNRAKVYDIIDVLLAIGNARGVSAARVALAWTLAQKGITSVIIGAKTVAQVQDNLAAINFVLTPEELAQLDAVSGLVKEYPAWMAEWQGRDRFPE